MNSFLMHYGIPGQKWGVRRYQNPDGTYTEEGKQRYGRDSESETNQSSEKSESNASDSSMRVNPLYHPFMATKEAIFPDSRGKRLEKARKAIAEKGLTDRFTDQELNKYSQVTNGSFRNMILKKMSKHPDMSYSRAYGASFLQSVATSVILLTAYNKLMRSKFMENKLSHFFAQYYKKKFSGI